MNDEQRQRVGFFRGLFAVLRGIARTFATLLGLAGRGVAAVSRRFGRTADGGDPAD